MKKYKILNKNENEKGSKNICEKNLKRSLLKESYLLCEK